MTVRFKPGSAGTTMKTGWHDDRMARQRLAGIEMDVPQIDAAFAIDLADGKGLRMLQHGDAIVGENLAHLLPLAQHVGLNATGVRSGRQYLPRT